MKKILLIILVLCCGVYASPGLVLVKNDSGDKLVVGVLINKNKRWFLTVLDRTLSHLMGGNLEIRGRNGNSPAKIIAEDPLYGVCVLEAENAGIMDGLEEVALGSGQVLEGSVYALKEGSFFLHHEGGARVEGQTVPVFIYPTQSVMLEQGTAFHKGTPNGAVLVGKTRGIEGLWHGSCGIGGWVPLSVLRDVVMKASLKTEDERHTVKSLYGVRFAYIDHHQAHALLGEVPYAENFCLYVEHVKDYGKPQGLEAGDVIVAVNGVRINGDFSALMREVRAAQEEEIPVQVIRYGEVLDVKTPVVSVKDVYDKPFFVVKDIFVFGVNQRLALTYGVSEGSCVSCFGKPRNHAHALLFVNGKEVSYEDVVRLQGASVVSPLSCTVAVPGHSVLFTRDYLSSSWDVRRVDVRKSLLQ